MKKLVIGLCFLLTLNLISPINAMAAIKIVPKTTTEKTVKYQKMRLVKVNEVPKGVKPVTFDTMEEANAWLSKVKQDIMVSKSRNSLYASNPLGIPLGEYTSACDYSCINYTPFPSGSGTDVYDVSQSVPGLTDQTITAYHTLTYDLYNVTDSSVYARIDGIGLATMNVRHTDLVRYGTVPFANFYSVCIVDFGYYLNIGGQSFGFFWDMELTKCLYIPSYVM